MPESIASGGQVQPGPLVADQYGPDCLVPAHPDEGRALSPEVEPDDADNPEPEADEAEPVEEA